ncbi:MAG: acyltransferase, partial [Gammaproteobacteria bacterium]|nr:acyltransferase [Gammaproteobacteria bacterium]
MSELSRASHYQPDIQGLRALAVILVIFYHSGLPGLPGGYIGVDVFFVISGYLITSLLLRELARNDAISLPRFYARRFRRLLPAATLVLIVTTLTAWFVYSPLALKQFSSSAFATAIYLSNIWFAHLSTDYLAEDTAANPLLHTWSLGVEEQFYLFWPLIMMIAYRVYRSRPAHQRLTVVFVALAAISFALEVWLTSYKQPWAFFGSPTRAWEFAAGGLLALGFARGALLSRTLATALGWLGFFLICAAAVLLDRSTPFPGTAALLPVLGASGLIAAAHTERRIGMSALLATRPLQLIGDLSYSLYLWHWPVFVFLAPASGEPD